jgi:hypothetical protein
MLMRGAAFADGPITEQEMLGRGAAAAKAASSVLIAVRWHQEDVAISRASCQNTRQDRWRCTVRFRDGDGNDLQGTAAPSVELTFSGRTGNARLMSCMLNDPQMGRAVDCTNRARRAVAPQRPSN